MFALVAGSTACGNSRRARPRRRLKGGGREAKAGRLYNCAFADDRGLPVPDRGQLRRRLAQFSSNQPPLQTQDQCPGGGGGFLSARPAGQRISRAPHHWGVRETAGPYRSWKLAQSSVRGTPAAPAARRLCSTSRWRWPGGRRIVHQRAHRPRRAFARQELARQVAQHHLLLREVEIHRPQAPLPPARRGRRAARAAASARARR